MGRLKRPMPSLTRPTPSAIRPSSDKKKKDAVEKAWKKWGDDLVRTSGAVVDVNTRGGGEMTSTHRAKRK